MESDSLEESFMKALPPMSSPRKNSVPPPLSNTTEAARLETKENADKSDKVKVPQGLVKGYGGAIEKSIAAQAATVSPQVRADRTPKVLKPTNTPKSNDEVVKPTDSGSGDKLTKTAEDTNSITALDNRLIHSWFMALARNDMETVKTMASEEPKLVLARDLMTGNTCVHWAAHHGNSDLVVYLCRNFPVNKSASTRSAGHTALHTAYIHHKVDTADVLINLFGFDTEERDYAGHTPAFYMATNISSTGLSSGNRSSTTHKHKTISKAFNTGLRRIGSLNAKLRSSMMRPRGPGPSYHMKKSDSSPLQSTFDRSDMAIMPPPTSAPRMRNRLPTDLFRRGSQMSDMSRSDSVISMDDSKSISNGKADKASDSESDCTSFPESESMDSFLQRLESTSVASPPRPVVKSLEGKTASPLIYTKTMNDFDDGSQAKHDYSK